MYCQGWFQSRCSMAATRSGNQQLKKLQDENARLRKANEELREQLGNKIVAGSRISNFFRKLAVVLCVSLAVALLFIGNLLFWAGNTVVKTDRYVAATAPIIKNPAVQSAIATNATQQFFANVDVNQVITQALPPRAEFLAPTITEQFKQHSNQAIKQILQRPQFQDRWNAAQEHAHDRFIRLVKEHGSDGSININEVYSDVSQQLKTTKLSFLADKPLPDSVGQIQVVQGRWLTVLQKTIQNIDTWRTVSIVLLVILSGLGIWLSRNRRRVAVILGSLFAVSMFVTAVGIRIIREVIAGKVPSQDSEAVRQAYTIFVHSLVVQTFTILAAALVMIFITWISGSSSNSRKVRLRLEQLFSGKLHGAIFSHGENGFTNWVGKYKRVLEWLIVILVAASTLFARLTPGVLFAQVMIILLLVLATEVLAAKL